MSKNTTSNAWKLLLPLTATGLALMGGTAQADRVVTLANGDWAPYQAEGLDGYGPASMVVEEAFATQGWTVEFEFLPWARGLSDTRVGRYEGTFLYSFNEERGEDFHFSDPVIELETVVFYHNDSPIQWEDEEDLKGLVLGTVVAYDYGFVTESAGYDLDRVPDPEANYQKLAAGRVDAVLEEVFVGLELAASVGVEDQVGYYPRPVKADPYHLIVSREHPDAEEIIETFNAGLAELEASGRLAEILQQD